MSRIVILDASPTGSPFADRIAEAAEALGPDCSHFHLEEFDIRFCTGCWTCWWKTPGRCVFPDDMERVLPGMTAAELVIIATPTTFGMPAAEMKKTLDRTIPLIHPYIELVGGECHHRKRYARYPKLALWADTGGNGGDFARIDIWVRRYARNFHAPVVFSRNETAEAEEIAKEARHALDTA